MENVTVWNGAKLGEQFKSGSHDRQLGQTPNRHGVCCSRSPAFILELSSLGFRDALCIFFICEESCILTGTMNDNLCAGGEQSLRETIAEIIPAKREQLARIVCLKKLCRFGMFLTLNTSRRKSTGKKV